MIYNSPEQLALLNNVTLDDLRLTGIAVIRETFAAELEDPLGLDPFDLNAVLDDATDALLGMSDTPLDLLFTRACSTTGGRIRKPVGARADASYAVATILGPTPDQVFGVLACGLSRRGVQPGSPEWERSRKGIIGKLKKVQKDC